MKCAHCGKDAYLGFQCKRCGGYFCAKDRLPENHNCAFRSMRSDEVAMRLQLEHELEPKVSRRAPYTDASGNERRMYQDRGEPRPYDDEDDEESEGRVPFRGMGVGGLDLMFSLVIFVIFAGMDLIFFLITPTPFLLFPLIVHGVFLPFLFYIAVKQRRGEFPPRIMVTFIQLIIAYMVVYMGAEIVVALVLGNILMIGIYLFIGILMVFIWSRVLQQLKYVFGRQ
ncbi:MAG: hypothetical protein JW839_19215 [Candidatus Lokiarchaeota archaeon]|nr:hypothetical protein [Candidatus Lokiarchaeota archaeon]